MKKYFAYALTLLATMFVAACSEGEGGYAGPNGVVLEVQGGNTTIIEDGDEAVQVQVSLDRSYDKDVALTISVQGEEPERLVVKPQPVIIAAGSTSATFEVSSAKLGNLSEQLQYTLTCTDLQKDMKMETSVIINIRPRTGMDDLTETQLALVDSWRTTYGIDITKWIGQVALSGEVTEPGDGSTEAFMEPNTTPLNGKTVITLGDGCTEDKIVLKMVDNPMGMTDFLRNWFLKNTIEDDEYFTPGETGPAVMALINWNKNTQETFNVTLDGIEIDLSEATESDGSKTFAINYVKEGDAPVLGLDGNPIDAEEYYYSKTSWIPFKYEYSAWTRLLQKVAEGDEGAMEYFNADGTSDPEYYLCTSPVNEDDYETEENNYYVFPSGSINFENGKMSFTFPADHAYAGGYSRVNITYTAN